MVKCEYSSCGADSPEEAFTRGRHWPCCGKPFVSYVPVVKEVQKVEEPKIEKKVAKKVKKVKK
jgi:hypothetical protein